MAPDDVRMPMSALSVTTELKDGEQDVQNVDFIKRLEWAWGVVSTHPMFRGIQEATPLPLGEGGSQAPYKHSDYLLALGDIKKLEPGCQWHFPPERRYTCAINLAWVDFQWSATPGVPVRMGALERLRDTAFKSPCPAPQVHVAVPKEAEYQPDMHKGALKQVSPEEITAAYIMAIARDIENQVEDYVLSLWRKHLRTCTCVFIVLDSARQMYFYALKQREALQRSYMLARRSCYQRLHEIVRLLARMRLTLTSWKESEITGLVVDEYKNNVVEAMPFQGIAAVTKASVGTTKIVAGRMLAVPEIASCMADFDEIQGLLDDFQNPFDCHWRLRAMLEKTAQWDENTFRWCMEGIWYHTKFGHMGPVDIPDISGSRHTHNLGWLDLIAYKKSLRDLLFRMAFDAFPAQSHVGLELFQKATSSHRLWRQAFERGGWLNCQLPEHQRMPLKDYEESFFEFLEEVVFNHAYDPSIKWALKRGLSVEDAMSEATLAGQWRGIMMYLEDHEDGKPLMSRFAPDCSLGLANHFGDFEFRVVQHKAIC